MTSSGHRTCRRTSTDKQEGETSLAAPQEPRLGPPGSHPPALCTSHFFLPWILEIYLCSQQHPALLAEFHCSARKAVGRSTCPSGPRASLLQVRSRKSCALGRCSALGRWRRSGARGLAGHGVWETQVPLMQTATRSKGLTQQALNKCLQSSELAAGASFPQRGCESQGKQEASKGPGAECRMACQAV